MTTSLLIDKFKNENYFKNKKDARYPYLGVWKVIFVYVWQQK